MSKKQRKGDPRPWVPMHEAQSIPHTPEQQAKIRAYIIDKGVPEDRADAEMAEMMTWPNEVWKNHHYTVHVDRRDDGSVQELSIRRDDRKPARDWRDFQRIKNEIAGENVEAVELYPMQERIVDTANQYFLWCLPPGQRFPLGFQHGMLANDDDAAGSGAVQRALPRDWAEAWAEVERSA